MKSFIVGLALMVAALAAPAVEKVDPSNIIDDVGTVSSANFTASAAANRAVGWGGWGAGTTGGQGGTRLTVWDAFALRDGLSSNNRRIIDVRGRISVDPLFVNSPGVRLIVGAFTTIQGGDRNAEITGGGLRITNVQQVIVRNLKIFNGISYAPGERPNGSGGISNLGSVVEFSEIDNIEISGSTYVWVDHVEFSDLPWTNTARRRHDGLLDIVRGADFITVSNCIFSNHNHVSLVGNNDNNAAVDNNRLRTTYFANWFRGTTQRNPRVRFGRVHVLNNLYTDMQQYGVGVGAGARIHLERNVFRNCRRAWGFASGVPNPPGALYNLVNTLVNSGHDANIPSNVGWNPWGTYPYSAIAIGQVEAHVRRYAGIL